MELGSGEGCNLGNQLLTARPRLLPLLPLLQERLECRPSARVALPGWHCCSGAERDGRKRPSCGCWVPHLINRRDEAQRRESHLPARREDHWRARVGLVPAVCVGAPALRDDIDVPRKAPGVRLLQQREGGEQARGPSSCQERGD